MAGSDVLQAALEYAARGWPVFPCAPRGKRPLIEGGFRSASTDPEQIERWWKRWPKANLGIPTGPSTFDVLDVDGPTGETTLAGLEAKHDELPSGPRQFTGKGRHLLFRGGTLGVTAGRLPGIDTRGDGGYVVFAPSVHQSGERYAAEDLEESLPEPPPWLIEELRAQGAAGAADPQPLGPPAQIDNDLARTLLEMAGIDLREIPEGSRNDRVFRIGASLRSRGLELEAILRTLTIVNEQLCRPQMDPREVETIARSAARLEVSALYRKGAEAAEKAAERAATASSEGKFARDATTVAANGKPVSEKLLWLRGQLGVELEGVTMLGRQPTVYYLRLAGQQGVRIRNLLSFAEVEKVLFDQLAVRMPVKRKDWPAAAILLRQIATFEDAEVGDEGGEVQHFLDGFLQEEPADRCEDEDDFRRLRMAGAPVIAFKGEVFIYFDSFRSYCDRAGLRERASALWRRLIESGALERVDRRIRLDGEVRATRRYWRVRQETLGYNPVGVYQH